MAKRSRLIAITASLAGLAPATALGSTTLATNPSGTQVLLHQVLKQASRPLYAGIRGAGGPWASFVPLPPAEGIGPRGAVVDDAGGAVVAWGTEEGGYDGAGAVMVALRPPGGKLRPPLQLKAIRPAALAVAGNARGDALVAWSYSTEIQYAFRPAGGDFGPVSVAPGAPGLVVGATLDPDGTATLVWSKYDVARGTYVVYTSTRPPGGEFGQPHELGGVPATAILAASRNGRALLVWNDRHSVMLAEREPGGDFGPPFAAAPAGEVDAIKGVAIAASGAAAIAYGHTPIKVTIRPPGSSFDAPARIGTVVDYIDPVGIAVNDRGDATVAWPGRDDAIQAAYRTARPRSWRLIELAPPRPLLPLPGGVPSVVIGGSGRATAAWEETNGAKVRTYTRGFDVREVGRQVQVDVVRSYVREGPPEACRPPGVRLAQDSGFSTVFEQNYRVYGCLAARGVPVQLNGEQPYDTQSPTRMALAGDLVAYGEDFYGSGVESSSLTVSDLRDFGNGLSRFASLASTDTAELAAIELKPNGAAAWVSCPSSDFPFRYPSYPCQHRGGESKQVWVWPRHRLHPQLVDHGRQIDPRSFRLRGSRLSWRNGRVLRHARLP